MAIYSCAVRSISAASASPLWELRTTSTDRVAILEIGVFLAAATASTIGLGRPAAIGVTPITTVTGVAEEPANPAGTGVVATAWTTAPTIPATFFRRISVPATVGTGVIWTFPRGLFVPISSSIILWNLALNGVTDVYVVWDE